MKKRRAHPEHDLQKAVAAFLHSAMPPGTNWTAIDHAGTSARHGAMLRARGVKSGVPDFHFTFHGCVYWIEMKTPTGRVSQEQKEFMISEQMAGAHWAVCHSVAEVELMLRGWGVNLRARLAA